MLKRLLLVDDSETSRRSLRTSLERAGFDDLELVEAGSGEEAWRLLREASFDMIVSDLYMPVMSGLELLERTRAAGHTVPVVILTSDRSQDLRTRLSDVQDAWLLPKPASAEQLARVLIHGPDHP